MRNLRQLGIGTVIFSVLLALSCAAKASGDAPVERTVWAASETWVIFSNRYAAPLEKAVILNPDDNWNVQLVLYDIYGNTFPVRYRLPDSAAHAAEKIRTGLSIDVSDCLKEELEHTEWAPRIRNSNLLCYACRQQTFHLTPNCGVNDFVSFVDMYDVPPGTYETVNVSERPLFTKHFDDDSCKEIDFDSVTKKSCEVAGQVIRLL
jgi:hypothetical protein